MRVVTAGVFPSSALPQPIIAENDNANWFRGKEVFGRLQAFLRGNRRRKAAHHECRNRRALARAAKLAGLSQEALAEKLGVSRQAVSKWERSESSPDTDNLIALAKLYGVSLDELLYVDESIEDDVAFEAADRAEVRGASRVVVAEASEETASPEGGGVGDACDAETARALTSKRRAAARCTSGPVAFTWTTARTMCTCPGPRACTWSTATAKRCTSVGTACASTRRIRRWQSISSRATILSGCRPMTSMPSELKSG